MHCTAAGPRQWSGLVLDRVYFLHHKFLKKLHHTLEKVTSHTEKVAPHLSKSASDLKKVRQKWPFGEKKTPWSWTLVMLLEFELID